MITRWDHVWFTNATDNPFNAMQSIFQYMAEQKKIYIGENIEGALKDSKPKLAIIYQVLLKEADRILFISLKTFYQVTPTTIPDIRSLFAC